MLDEESDFFKVIVDEDIVETQDLNLRKKGKRTTWPEWKEPNPVQVVVRKILEKLLDQES